MVSTNFPCVKICHLLLFKCLKTHLEKKLKENRLFKKAIKNKILQ